VLDASGIDSLRRIGASIELMCSAFAQRVSMSEVRVSINICIQLLAYKVDAQLQGKTTNKHVSTQGGILLSTGNQYDKDHKKADVSLFSQNNLVFPFVHVNGSGLALKIYGWHINLTPISLPNSPLFNTLIAMLFPFFSYKATRQPATGTKTNTRYHQGQVNQSQQQHNNGDINDSDLPQITLDQFKKLIRMKKEGISVGKIAGELSIAKRFINKIFETAPKDMVEAVSLSLNLLVCSHRK